MQHLEVIPLSAIEPDKKNPRKDFGDIKAMAETFSGNGGEPYNAIVVVKDGSIYRIVDGERRYRAMKHLKVEQCHAIVCEDMDDANSMLAMLATDDKLTLTQGERSQGVQQMLLLGVDPKQVEKVAKLKKGQGGKLSRAMLKVGEMDRAATMTIDHLLAIDEFKDDPEAVEELASCDPDNWKAKASNIRRMRAAQAAYDALAKACSEIGVELVEKAPKGAVVCTGMYSLESHVDDMADYLKEKLAVYEGELVEASNPKETGSSYLSATIYKKARKKTLSDVEAAAIATENAVKKANSRDKRRRAEFVAQKLQEGGAGAIPVTSKPFEEWLEKDIFTYKFRKLSGAEEMKFQVTPYVVAVAWEYIDNITNDALLDIVLGGKKRSYHSVETLGSEAIKYANLLDALQTDGYEPSDEEKVYREDARKVYEDSRKAAEIAKETEEEEE